MKCWAYSDYPALETAGEDYDGGIVFAETEQDALVEVARRIGERVEDVNAKLLTRKEKFDQYAPGPVPTEALLEAGWYFDCLYCEKRINWWGCDCSENDCDHEDCPCKDKCVCKPTFDGRDVFCSPGCAKNWAAERKRDSDWREELKAKTLARFPGSTIKWVSGYCVGESKIGDVCFDLPGTKAGIRWHTEGPDHLYVAPIDMAVWKAYEEALLADKRKRTDGPSEGCPVPGQEGAQNGPAGLTMGGSA